MKKIIGLCLTFTLLLGCISTTVMAAGKISKEDVAKTTDYVINWYNSGEYYQYGHCQGFVNQCWKRALGGSWSSTCCARKGWDAFGVSKSKDDIPVGASIYFSKNKGSKCSGCGNYPGHAAFYIGNGEIIHVYNRVVDSNGKQVYMDSAKTKKAGYIRRTTIDAVINDGYTYLGWGWHSNKELEVGNVCSHSYTDPNTELCSKCGVKYQRIEKSENKKYIVNAKSINLRTVPYSKAGGSNGVSYAGEIVTSSLNVINMYGNEWVKISNNNGQSGYTSIENLKEYSEPKASSLKINLTKYPTSLKKGSNFGLRGTVSSNYNVKQIKGYILNGNTTVQSTVDTLNKKTVDVSGIKLNNNLIFNNLGTGNYTLVVEATDSSGRTVTVKKYFDVYVEQTKIASTLAINLARYPVTLKQGTSFGLRGSVDSNYTIVKVRGYVKNSSGSTVLSSTDTPNSTSMNIQYADLNNSLVFNKLSPGNYTMVVEATDNSGRVVTATKNFTVQGNSTQQTINTSNNGTGVQGVVNIPSSWTDLSIRSGPSTNYQVVGGMPQGAKCTVYPDKTSNGWYYVNYNGIWGYASGKQITLNSGNTQTTNTRIGIVNIPSSWTDLSIRTGPSTNYQLIGGMPQGARCTVYPEKASNGWYYVEYNGIKGYAAGNRINLQ